jgi:hypothetical protein
MTKKKHPVQRPQSAQARAAQRLRFAVHIQNPMILRSVLQLALEAIDTHNPAKARFFADKLHELHLLENTFAKGRFDEEAQAVLQDLKDGKIPHTHEMAAIGGQLKALRFYLKHGQGSYALIGAPKDTRGERRKTWITAHLSTMLDKLMRWPCPCLGACVGDPQFDDAILTRHKKAMDEVDTFLRENPDPPTATVTIAVLAAYHGMTHDALTRMLSRYPNALTKMRSRYPNKMLSLYPELFDKMRRRHPLR